MVNNKKKTQIITDLKSANFKEIKCKFYRKGATLSEKCLEFKGKCVK